MSSIDPWGKAYHYPAYLVYFAKQNVLLIKINAKFSKDEGRNGQLLGYLSFNIGFLEQS